MQNIKGIKIICRDEDLLVVDKPGGLPTQPQRGGKGESLAHLLAERFPEIKTVGGIDWGACHRLDVETSGLIVFARNQSSYDFLRREFSKGQVIKEYTALVEGQVAKGGRIEWPIGPGLKSSKKVQVYRNPKEARRNKALEAVTIYSPLPRGERDTWLCIQIKTGRRHQIRAHLAAIGHPIVGDKLYGQKNSGETTLHLHASRLKFRHPSGNHWVEAESRAAFFE